MKKEFNINIQSYFKLESDHLFSSIYLNTVSQNLKLLRIQQWDDFLSQHSMTLTIAMQRHLVSF
jgi:hypothetical protein